MDLAFGSFHFGVVWILGSDPFHVFHKPKKPPQKPSSLGWKHGKISTSQTKEDSVLFMLTIWCFLCVSFLFVFLHWCTLFRAVFWKSKPRPNCSGFLWPYIYHVSSNKINFKLSTHPKRNIERENWLAEEMLSCWVLVGGWTNPIWKIWGKLDHFPKFRGEHKKYLKPPPRTTLGLLSLFEGSGGHRISTLSTINSHA